MGFHTQKFIYSKVIFVIRFVTASKKERDNATHHQIALASQFKNALELSDLGVHVCHKSFLILLLALVTQEFWC